MEIRNQNIALREDSQLLVITHLTQYLDYVTGFGGVIVPLILWLSNKDTVLGMNEHGKAVINLQLSLILYVVIGIPGILLLGLGVLLLVFAGILSLVMPAVNAVRASNGGSPSYFGTIRFIA
ncbi:MAG: tRNA modification GTPase [Maribacter sp.]|nr:MAG: tRNA modification GTPase [Maribacter sp.]